MFHVSSLASVFRCTVSKSNRFSLDGKVSGNEDDDASTPSLCNHSYPSWLYLRSGLVLCFLLYATVHKTRVKRRVKKIDYRLVFGTEDHVKSALEQSRCSRKINTSFTTSSLSTLIRHKEKMGNSRIRGTYVAYFNRIWKGRSPPYYFLSRFLVEWKKLFPASDCPL